MARKTLRENEEIKVNIETAKKDVRSNKLQTQKYLIHVFKQGITDEKVSALILSACELQFYYCNNKDGKYVSHYLSELLSEAEKQY